MKTVGDFKAVGVVFVVGDDLHQNPTPVGDAWSKNINKTSDFDYYTIKSFAWRNLSTMPEVPCYIVEVDAVNDKWRPSLNQYGSECIKTDGGQVVNFDIGADQVETLSVGKIEFEAHKANTDTLFRLTKFLVDNNIGKIGECCVDVAIRELTKKPSIKMLSALEEAEEIETGFVTHCQLITPTCKPVFTQAMADAGELPPVGSECRFSWSEEEGNYGRTLKIIAYDDEKTLMWAHLDGNKSSNLYKIEKFNFYQKTITVNGFEVPEPVLESPKNGDKYFIPSLIAKEFNCEATWSSDSVDKELFGRCICHTAKEAAIAHAKAMLGIDPNADA